MTELMQRINSEAISPAMALLPPKIDSIEARVLMLAIGAQESRLIARDQRESADGRDLVPGPALGLWQFERGGGVKGVMSHPASKEYAKAVAAARGVAWDRQALWLALETDDVLAAAFARLLILTDAYRLPAIGKGAEAWALYIRTWRPGKPHPSTWQGCYAQAVETMRA